MAFYTIRRYKYGIGCEYYIAEGVMEFIENYDSQKDRVWICEHKDRIVGFIFLMHRDDVTAQLRYFLIEPGYRGIGLGSRLINLYMKFFQKCGYKKSYLWTTKDLTAAAFLYKRAGFRLTEEKQTTTFGKLVTEQRYDLIS